MVRQVYLEKKKVCHLKKSFKFSYLPHPVHLQLVDFEKEMALELLESLHQCDFCRFEFLLKPILLFIIYVKIY